MTASAATPRKPDHAIDPLFFRRWSPRAFTGEEIPVETLMGLFEAARWAPSAMNAQPWLLRLCKAWRARIRSVPRCPSPVEPAPGRKGRGSRRRGLARADGRLWQGRAGPIGEPLVRGRRSVGAARLASPPLGLEHPCHGRFDREKAGEALSLPAHHRIEVFVAIGRQGEAAILPDWAKVREKPNDRFPLAELV